MTSTLSPRDAQSSSRQWEPGANASSRSEPLIAPPSVSSLPSPLIHNPFDRHTALAHVKSPLTSATLNPRGPRCRSTRRCRLLPGPPTWRSRPLFKACGAGALQSMLLLSPPPPCPPLCLLPSHCSYHLSMLMHAAVAVRWGRLFLPRRCVWCPASLWFVPFAFYCVFFVLPLCPLSNPQGMLLFSTPYVVPCPPYLLDYSTPAPAPVAVSGPRPPHHRSRPRQCLGGQRSSPCCPLVTACPLFPAWCCVDARSLRGHSSFSVQHWCALHSDS